MYNYHVYYIKLITLNFSVHIKLFCRIIWHHFQYTVRASKAFVPFVHEKFVNSYQ